MNIQFVSGKFSARDNNDRAAVGYLLWIVVSGTSTAGSSYSDPDCTVPNTSPYIVLDYRGEAFVYVNALSDAYLTIPTATDVSSSIWECRKFGGQQQDPVTGEATPPTLNNNYVMNTVPPVLVLYKNLQLTMIPDVDNADTIVSNVFTGTGVNDLTVVGPYTGAAPAVFTFWIDSLAVNTDTNMQLLLHGDGSGATIVDSSATPKTVTSNGDVTQNTDGATVGSELSSGVLIIGIRYVITATQTDYFGSGLVIGNYFRATAATALDSNNKVKILTNQYKFNVSSILFDGVGDYLSLADSADWVLGTGDFTIEGLWTPTVIADTTFVAEHQDANNTFYFDYVASTHKLRFYFKDASTVRADYDYTWNPTAYTRYHLAVVRSGTNFYLFIDGTLTAWTTTTTAISTNSLGNLAGLLTIGYGANIGTYFAGYLEEFVWSKGIARHTATFVIDTQAHSSNGVDTFKWKKDGGAWTELVPIASGQQTLIEGIKYTFAVLTGHTLGDIWATTVETPARVNLDTLGNLLVYKNKGGSVVALDGNDMLAGYPAQLILNEALNAWLLINPATPVFGPTTITANRYRKNFSADYDQILNDQGYELNFIGTVASTLTLLTCPEFSGKFCYVTNSGTALLTVDAGIYAIFGSGESTYLLAPGNSIQLDTDGVDWHVLTTTGSRSLVARETVTAGLTVTIDNLLINTRYRLVGQILSLTGVDNLGLQFNADTGNNYQSAANRIVHPSTGVPETLTGTSIRLTDGAEIGTEIMFEIEFISGTSDPHKTFVNGHITYFLGVHIADCILSGYYAGSADLTSVTLFKPTTAFTGTISLEQYN